MYFCYLSYETFARRNEGKDVPAKTSSKKGYLSSLRRKQPLIRLVRHTTPEEREANIEAERIAALNLRAFKRLKSAEKKSRMFNSDDDVLELTASDEGDKSYEDIPDPFEQHSTEVDEQSDWPRDSSKPILYSQLCLHLEFLRLTKANCQKLKH